MKKLFFTTTRPKHPYKSEKFFHLYKRLRYKVAIGCSAGRSGYSNFKRMLVLKKFFCWYFSFLGNHQFFKILKKVFQYNKGFSGIFYRFLLLLENHLQVAVVRSTLISNLNFAKTLIQAKLLLVNGEPANRNYLNFFIHTGDVVELGLWQILYSLYREFGIFYIQEISFFNLQFNKIVKKLAFYKSKKNNKYSKYLGNIIIKKIKSYSETYNNKSRYLPRLKIKNKVKKFRTNILLYFYFNTIVQGWRDAANLFKNRFHTNFIKLQNKT